MTGLLFELILDSTDLIFVKKIFTSIIPAIITSANK